MDYETYLRRETGYYARYKTYNAIKTAFLRSYFRLYHRLEVSGAERIPPGPALIAANHAGGFDLDLLALSFFAHPSREITPLITESWHFTNSLWGRLVVGCGIPLPTRGGIPSDHLDRYLRPGGSRYPGLVCIFPEGNIKHVGERHSLGMFYPGVARIALRYRVPVVPAAMIGFADASPIIKVIPHDRAPDDVLCPPFAFPFKLRIKFGSPVHLDRYYGKDHGKAGEYWIANMVVRPRLHDLFAGHCRVSLDEVRAEMRDPLAD